MSQDVGTTLARFMNHHDSLATGGQVFLELLALEMGQGAQDKAQAPLTWGVMQGVQDQTPRAAVPEPLVAERGVSPREERGLGLWIEELVGTRVCQDDASLSRG